jgi:tRNA(Ile)-lysidine synthase
VTASETWIDGVARRVGRWSHPRALGRRWVLAVSGGGDSVALLRLLHEIAGRVELELSVAHLDHGTRGASSRADAAFVAELSRSLGIACDVGRWRAPRPAHFESDARRARYAWLVEIARARGASVVAVAHTSDDQAETILHRIVRGTGIRGLAGMPWRRLLARDPKITLVRPLLDIPRRSLRDYLATRGQAFHEDETNLDTGRTRARIRNELLPQLEARYNPRVAEALVRLGAHAAAYQRLLDAELEILERAAVLTNAPDCVVFSRRELAAISGLLRCELLRRVWRRAGWPEVGMSARRWWRLAKLVRKHSVPKVMIGAGVVVLTDRDSIVLRREHLPGANKCMHATEPRAKQDRD